MSQQLKLSTNSVNHLYSNIKQNLSKIKPKEIKKELFYRFTILKLLQLCLTPVPQWTLAYLAPLSTRLSR